MNSLALSDDDQRRLNQQIRDFFQKYSEVCTVKLITSDIARHHYRKSHAILDHTVLPATRRRWLSCLYLTRSWYSIERPLRDARLSWPGWWLHRRIVYFSHSSEITRHSKSLSSRRLDHPGSMSDSNTGWLDPGSHLSSHVIFLIIQLKSGGLVNICDDFDAGNEVKLHRLAVIISEITAEREQIHKTKWWVSVDWQLIADSSRRTLRSSVTATFVVPRTNSTFGYRSFAVAGSRIWNSLPTSLRSVDLSTEHFKRTLKTFLFVWDRSASVTLFKVRRI